MMLFSMTVLIPRRWIKEGGTSLYKGSRNLSGLLNCIVNAVVDVCIREGPAERISIAFERRKYGTHSKERR